MLSIENGARLGGRAISLAVALAVPASALTFSTPAAAQNPVVLAIVDVKLVALGFRISELIGKPVYNPQGQKIGHVDDFIIQRDRVLMTIINVGGFLGIGGRLIAIPYSSLRMTRKGMVLPGASKQAVGKLPAFHYR
ncbi:MAG TPA: PRC-barrel domain-containing protein [Sphingomicrobium sp.]|jgi:sporulation protein YlmC with PRC-barrel domain|nr:PRC-barrel domain-containing protein [Sphingomicrobium sp.]